MNYKQIISALLTACMLVIVAMMAVEWVQVSSHNAQVAHEAQALCEAHSELSVMDCVSIINRSYLEN